MIKWEISTTAADLRACGNLDVASHLRVLSVDEKIALYQLEIGELFKLYTVLCRSVHDGTAGSTVIEAYELLRSYLVEEIRYRPVGNMFDMTKALALVIGSLKRPWLRFDNDGEIYFVFVSGIVPYVDEEDETGGMFVLKCLCTSTQFEQLEVACPAPSLADFGDGGRLASVLTDDRADYDECRFTENWSVDELVTNVGLSLVDDTKEYEEQLVEMARACTSDRVVLREGASVVGVHRPTAIEGLIKLAASEPTETMFHGERLVFDRPTQFMVEKLSTSQASPTYVERFCKRHFGFWRSWDCDLKYTLPHMAECTLNECRYIIPHSPIVKLWKLNYGSPVYAHIGSLEPSPYVPQSRKQICLSDDVAALLDGLAAADTKLVFKDVVSGKSEGKNIMLLGPPGVGKTLFVEVLSEMQGRPLLTVKCSDLPMNPSELWSRLAEVGQLAERCNCLVLLDDIDVLVAARRGELLQYSLMSTTLRFLERHSVWVFMTTNMQGDIDSAVLSRCMATVLIKSPDANARREIWKTALLRNGLRFTGNQLDDLASYPYSGRAITQSIKLAMTTKLIDKDKTKRSKSDIAEFCCTISKQFGGV